MLDASGSLLGIKNNEDNEWQFYINGLKRIAHFKPACNQQPHIHYNPWACDGGNATNQSEAAGPGDEEEPDLPDPDDPELPGALWASTFGQYSLMSNSALDKINYYIYDHLGNTRMVYQTQKYSSLTSLVNITDYYPFGKELRFYKGEPNEKFLSTQHERDRASNYDHRQARNSTSEFGVFLSVDPHADSYPHATPYSYVENNPIVRIDPDGRDWKDIFQQQKDGSYNLIEKNDFVVDEYRNLDGSVQFYNKQSGSMSKKINNATGEVNDTPQNSPREFNFSESYGKFTETTEGKAFESTTSNYIILITLPISGISMLKAPTAIEKVGAAMSFINGVDDLSANFTRSGETTIQQSLGNTSGNFTKGLLGLIGVKGGVTGLTKVPFKPSTTSPIDNIIGIGGDMKSTGEGFLKCDQNN
ncbi:MAG: RHS repeat domain-containing protein [Luteibaculaceae bacterium]